MVSLERRWSRCDGGERACCGSPLSHPSGGSLSPPQAAPTAPMRSFRVAGKCSAARGCNRARPRAPKRVQKREDVWPRWGEGPTRRVGEGRATKSAFPPKYVLQTRPKTTKNFRRRTLSARRHKFLGSLWHMESRMVGGSAAGEPAPPPTLRAGPCPHQGASSPRLRHVFSARMCFFVREQKLVTTSTQCSSSQVFGGFETCLEHVFWGETRLLWLAPLPPCGRVPLPEPGPSSPLLRHALKHEICNISRDLDAR